MGGRLVNIEKHGGKNRTCLIITYRKETYRQVNLKDIFKESIIFPSKIKWKNFRGRKNTIIMNGR